MSRLVSIAPTHRQAGPMLRRCGTFRLEAGTTLGADELRGSKLLAESGIVQVTKAVPLSRRPAVLALAGAGSVLPPLAHDELLGSLMTAEVIVVPAPAYQLLLTLPSVAGAVVNGLLETLRERQETLANTNRKTHPERLRGTRELSLPRGRDRPTQRPGRPTRAEPASRDDKVTGGSISRPSRRGVDSPLERERRSVGQIETVLRPSRSSSAATPASPPSARCRMAS
jgi:hypothetical protein